MASTTITTTTATTRTESKRVWNDVFRKSLNLDYDNDNDNDKDNGRDNDNGRNAKGTVRRPVEGERLAA
jgi:hypothetical protein